MEIGITLLLTPLAALSRKAGELHKPEPLRQYSRRYVVQQLQGGSKKNKNTAQNIYFM